MLPHVPAHGTRRLSAGRSFAALVALLAAVSAPSRVGAQQDTTQRPMPGMPGMKAPPTPKKTAKPKAPPRPTPAAGKVKPKASSDSLRNAAPPHAVHQVATDSAARDSSRMQDMKGMKDSAATARDTSAMPAMPAMPTMSGMAGMTVHDTGAMKGMAAMPMIDGPLGIPMERTGSGTSWLPDNSPMHAYHVMAGPWELMLHGVAFAMYDRQASRRGDTQFSSVNWGMLMATRNAGGGRLQLRAMMSAEPWTVGAKGYPLLLQTGESYRGVPLRDRQHPHDLFMELAGLYEHAVSDRVGVSLYVAPVGEPAIGPVAFPHRPSAMNDPMAPIAHHWQDATHISFGVLTGGVFMHTLRLEGSIFNGREPDENRTNFEYRGRSLDSYAGRLSWNPSAHWALSGSYAYLASPEALNPDEPVRRLSASIMNGRTFGQHDELATTFVYGANRHSGAAHLEPSYLLESNLEFGGAHSVFGRAEYVQKSAADLVLGASAPRTEFNVGSLVAGYVYEFDRAGSVRTGIGVRGSVDLIPSALEPYYGTRTPAGFAVYVRFRPQRMSEGRDKRAGEPMDVPMGAHH